MALTEDTAMVVELPGCNDIPLVSGAKVYEGSAISVNSAGYAHALTAGEVFAGHAIEGIDNTNGTNGALSVRVRAEVPYRAEVTLSGVAQTNVGDKVYMSDDNTYTLSSGSSAVLVGICIRYVTTNTCVVEFYPNAASILQ